ncbi:50S ribosomal protein L11 methyltransferase [Lactococcus allomyrinae]|uniref:Ribosomal protein L11 methyltransferase n=1 Tax=Lactococcus allomyrinae TaxID=2419773 RepID=A0A387BGS9_9LACT|nr:50S ribosomal protein L11 methyltransferase [Lactococcus allomyrinae]AYG01474.1 50S ribosomal protein L11 methyltransferase [Lactococcus allomyrinae]
MNNWNSITVKITRAAEETISAILIEVGAAGVEINDSADYLMHEDQFGEVLPYVEQSDLVEVTAYYPENLPIVELKADIEHKISGLSEFFDLTDLSVLTNNLSETNWADAWKKYFEPARVTHDLTIVPSWTEDYHATDGEKLIRLDPGMAFGTGTHPTTKMSLYALEQVLRGGEMVLDVGTGSGVLSVASVLLGAAEVHAYDIDEVAVRVALENIQLNADYEKIYVSANNLLENVTQEADVIVANILADILVLMTEDAYRLVKPEGYLIMSGIIAEKADMVIASAENAGFFLETRMTQGEWNCVIFKKTENREGVIGG